MKGTAKFFVWLGLIIRTIGGAIFMLEYYLPNHFGEAISAFLQTGNLRDLMNSFSEETLIGVLAAMFVTMSWLYVFGALALYVLSERTRHMCRTYLVPEQVAIPKWVCVCTLIFCSVCAGILMLAIRKRSSISDQLAVNQDEYEDSM